MPTQEQERLWLTQAEQQLARLDKEIGVSERRLKELNEGGYFGDEQTYEEARATLANAYAQMRAHRRQVGNRLDQQSKALLVREGRVGPCLGRHGVLREATREVWQRFS